MLCLLFLNKKVRGRGCGSVWSPGKGFSPVKVGINGAEGMKGLCWGVLQSKDSKGLGLQGLW